MNNLKDKRILIVGIGKSGIAATQALLKLGAKVTVQDMKDVNSIEPQLIKFLEGKNVECCFGEIPDVNGTFDMVILSPGVSPNLEFIREARESGAEIVGELEIAARISQGKYVAITGTNGKTTTTTLVGEIFTNSKRKTYVVGNIGVAVISMALSAEKDSWLVTETSSFQLETIKYFRPEVSAILNLTPDHLDRHKTMENYGEAKARIFENQDQNQYFIVNYDDKACYELSKNCKAKVVPFSRLEQLDFGAFVKNDTIVIKNEKGQITEFCNVNELCIPGKHNLENALAATAISYFAGIEKDIIVTTLKEFMGVEHRLEFVSEVDGIRFVNDSKGTNPDASIKAIDAIDGGIVLIAGGYDKNADFAEFINSFGGKVKHLLLIGKTAQKIKKTAEELGFTNILMLKDMEECVKEGYRLAQKGDTVLLSPACASWDMYTCFEQRGEHFKNCVIGLER